MLAPATQLGINQAWCLLPSERYGLFWIQNPITKHYWEVLTRENEMFAEKTSSLQIVNVEEKKQIDAQMWYLQYQQNNKFMIISQWNNWFCDCDCKSAQTKLMIFEHPCNYLEQNDQLFELEPYKPFGMDLSGDSKETTILTTYNIRS